MILGLYKVISLFYANDSNTLERDLVTIIQEIHTFFLKDMKFVLNVESFD